MEDSAAQRVAETLLAEHKGKVRFRTLTPPDGPASISDSYDIQARYVALLRGEHGDTAGYKVGLTSATMQQFCRIDHPIGGVVLAKRVHHSGATVQRRDYGRLGLEFEVAVRFRSDVPVTAYTRKTIAPHLDGVCAAIELVDEFSTTWPDLESMLGRATRDGAAIGEGFGRDILGHPFNSAAWMATQLASRGEAIKAGQVVMTGSVMKTVFPEEAGNYRFEFAGLGLVEVLVR
jgi:2-keto-4-pentenoate hydratase